MPRLPVLVFVTSLVVTAGCGSPTAPDSRTGVIYPVSSCSGDGAAPLACTVRETCTGYCTGSQMTSLRDLTAMATWRIEGTAVRHIGNGRFEAIGVGDVLISATVPGSPDATAGIAAAVFPGRQAQPTYALSGTLGTGIYEPTPLGPRPVFSSYINGATVEIVDGLLAGRRAVTGQPPAPVPGFSLQSPPFGDGSFRFFGVPTGSYVLDISPPGRPSLRVTADVGFSGFVNVVLP